MSGKQKTLHTVMYEGLHPAFLTLNVNAASNGLKIPQTDGISKGRSSGSWIILLTAPSRSNALKQWPWQFSSPITAAGPLPVCTGFPFKRFMAPFDNFLGEVLRKVNLVNYAAWLFCIKGPLMSSG
jgi:hypothetical protein